MTRKAKKGRLMRFYRTLRLAIRLYIGGMIYDREYTPFWRGCLAAAKVVWWNR